MKTFLLTTLLGFSTLATASALQGDQSQGLQRELRRPVTKSPPARFVRAREHFDQVRQMLKREHVDRRLTEEELYHAATQGMLNALNQRKGRAWNTLMSPTEYKELSAGLKGETSGLGIEIQFIDATGTASILSILPDSPAAKAGLQPGDQILSVNGRLYKGLDQRDMVYDILGPLGEKVSLKILRGAQVVDKDIVRSRVNWSSISSQLHDKKFGYIKIRSFSQDTPQLLKKTLKGFEKQQVKGLILDLRQNSGGLFEMAIGSADLLLPKGQVITQVRSRGGYKRKITSRQNPLLRTPMVVLVDRRTSSGAELLAVSLKDNLGVKIIGEKTFGKWNAQVIRRLPNHFAVKFTTKEFFSPKNQSYQDIGITPDVLVSNSTQNLHGALGRRPSNSSPKTPPQASDRQIQTAIQWLEMMI